MTLLCVPILVEDPARAMNEAREARDRGGDLVEFRVDGYFTGDAATQEAQTREIIELVSRCPLPCAVTCRPVLEGGHYDGPDDARIALMEALATAHSPEGTAEERKRFPPRYIDVELSTYARSANIKQKVNLAVDHPGQVREVSTSLILSLHDFHTRPADLIRRLEQMFAEPAARVVKVAYRARSLRDNLELLDILAEVRSGTGSGGKPMIALAMGPFGLMSRVLAPKFDAFLTFASLRRSAATAPGQPIISELLETYRFRSIGSATKVYGVVGYPVERSLSPLVHNAGFEAIGHDGVYLPMPVPAEYEHFKATIPALIDHVHLDLCGLSVTMPHKEHLVRLARESIADGDARWELSRLCEMCGSGNTVTITRDAKGRATRILIDNTDAAAAAALVNDAVGGTGVAHRAVCVLGAGGTARAVVCRLVEEGCVVLLVNRTREKAVALVEELRRAGLANAAERIRVAEAAEVPALRPAAVLNCTPVGMRSGPAPDALAMDEAVLRNLPAGTLVADCVYDPATTPLLEAARRCGLKTQDGPAMFVRQAAEQFFSWTRTPAPTRLFDRVVRETLMAT